MRARIHQECINELYWEQIFNEVAKDWGYMDLCASGDVPLGVARNFTIIVMTV